MTKDPEKHLRRELLEALIDYKYLLNRGYKSKGALNLVTSRYLLTREERMLLYRCVHSDSDVISIQGKTVNEILGRHLIIDGYNVLLTVAAAIEGLTLYLCDDGIVRDLRSAKIKDFSAPSIMNAIEIVRDATGKLGPSNVTLFLDKSVSMSAEHSKIIRMLSSRWEVILASRTDTEVISSRGVIASSDYVILMKAKEIYDLAGFIVLKKFPDQVVDLQRYLKRNLNNPRNQNTNWRGPVA